MHRTALLLVLVMAAARAGEAAPPAAHDPRFAQADLWPEDVAKAGYAQQRWEPARLLVWAPGRFAGDVNAPGNWLEDGKPATAGPDEKTDLLIPAGAGGKGYWVDGSQARVTARHLTVGDNVRLSLNTTNLHGNMWIRPGGTFTTRGFHHLGGANTFARCDSGGRLTAATKGLYLRKADGSSLELLGSWQTADWFQVDNGTLILGPGCVYGGGNRHQNVVGPQGVMAVLGGATFTTYQAKAFAFDLDVHGTLLIGLPERPLTRDALFLLNAKRESGRSAPGDRSLQTRAGSTVAVHSADPARARLVCRLRPDGDHRQAKPAIEEDEDDGLPKNAPAPAAAGERKLDFRLLGTVTFAGALFEDVGAGGMQVPDPAAAQAAWTHITWGKGCAPADAVFAVADKAINAAGDVLSNPQLTPQKPKPKP